PADRAKRTQLHRTIAVTTGGVGALLLIASGVVGHKNGALVDDTAARAEQVAKVAWDEPDRSPEDFDKLDALRQRLVELDTWTRQGPPLRYGLGMFVGRDLLPGVRALYQAELARVMVTPVARELAVRVGQIRYQPDRRPETRADDFATLKAYLMLSD